LLEPIEENGGAELKVVIGWIEGQGSEPMSSRVVYSGLMNGMEPTRLQLQEMAECFDEARVFDAGFAKNMGL